MNETIKQPEPVHYDGLPLNLLLRRRREELGLRQIDIGEALNVSGECVGQWETGRRRMELGKLPRLAAVLKMDARNLCIRALAEFHPALYEALVGSCDLAAPISLPLAS